MKISQIVLGLLLTLVILLIVIKIFIPAYTSVQKACGEKDNIITENSVVLGSFSVNGNSSVITINENAPEELKETINKHELCHKRQWEQQRIGNCDNGRVKLLYNEMECYVKGLV